MSNKPVFNFTLGVDPVVFLVQIIILIVKAFGAGIFQKAILRWQASEISLVDFKELAPNDIYSSPPGTKKKTPLADGHYVMADCPDGKCGTIVCKDGVCTLLDCPTGDCPPVDCSDGKCTPVIDPACPTGDCAPKKIA